MKATTRFFALILTGLAVLPIPARASENVTQLIRDSQQAQAEGRADEALRLAQRAVDLDPAHPPAWRQQGLALLRGGQAEAAAAALRRAVAMDEQDAEAWRGLALAQWRAEQRNEAVRALSAYLRLRPEDAAVWRDLAAWLTRLDRGDAAVAALERVVVLNPGDASAWRELGAWRLRLGRDADAAAALEQVVALKADDQAAWRDLATALTREGRLEPATAARERVVALAPQDADAWRALALLHQRRERFDEAAQAFERALAIRRDDPASLRDLGWIRWKQGRRDEAVAQLTAAVLGGVDNRERVVSQVVAGLAEAGAGDRALVFLRAVNPQEPPSAQGLALARAGRLRAAEPILASAWQTGDQTPDVGLHLAYVRAVNGRFTDLAAHLEPLLATPGALTPDRADLALEVLRIGGNRPEAPALATRLEAGLKTRERYSRRVTDILETAAEASRVRDAPEQALSLYRRVIERDPNRACWIWAVLLAERVEGRTPFDWLDTLAKQVSTPARAAGVQGLRADRMGQGAAAIAALQQSVQLEPNQPPLRQILFRNLLEQGRVDDARAEVTWFRRQVEAGESVLRSYLAEMLTRLGDTEEALGQWEILHQSNPEMTYYGLETATALFRLGRSDEACNLLRDLAGMSSDPRVFELLAEITSARGHYAEAADWAQRGLAVAPSQGLLRYHAESLDKLGTNAPAALASARAFLARDPGYVPLTLLAGRLMDTAGETHDAVAFQRKILACNPAFVPALSALRDQLARADRIDEAVAVARRHVEIQPGHAEARRAYANVLAQQGRFRTALEALRPLARKPLGQAVPILVYRDVTPPLLAGRNSVPQIASHLALLADLGYTFVNRFDAISDAPDARQAMIVLIDPGADVIEALDPVLQRHDARVVYAGHAAIPALTLSGTPLPAHLAEVLASDRWRLAAGGPAGMRRQPVNAAGTLGNPLTHPLMTGQGLEREADFAARLDRTLTAAAGVLTNQDERILVYPSGDFGQRSLDTGADHLATLRQAVDRHFTHAIYLDDSGFFLTDAAADRLRIPARAVPSDWDAAALAVYLGTGHPLTRARLELARVLYWNGQHEAAHAAFTAAEQAGADPRDLLFNWGLNAERQGDAPTACDKLHAALALDPASARIEHALTRLDEQRRPQASAFASGWRDNEDRDHFRYGLFGDAYAAERLRLGVMADHDRWSTDGLGSESGTRFGVRGLGFLTRQIWLSGSLWRLNMDDGLDNHWGGEAALRLPNPLLSGSLSLTAAREELETVEALRAGIDAATYGLRTYTRGFDVLDLFADLSQIERSDDNDTTMFEGRLLYRLREWPYTGIGWRFRFADSDRDPDEYWAPEELEQHQLQLALRGAWGRLGGSATAEAGYARERDTDWRFVWGARGRLDWSITHRLGLNGELGYFESPDYDRLFGRVGLTGRF